VSNSSYSYVSHVLNIVFLLINGNYHLKNFSNKLVNMFVSKYLKSRENDE